MSVAKVSEISATSAKSFEDAIHFATYAAPGSKNSTSVATRERSPSIN